ncbi:MAG: ornithine carbamoyltransferase [Dictyoglomaceae bacterium]|nr:ornithine carbamoyltransferase [Dictyoglomaceae bacterium]HOP94977.1 ornithine carbamoyltransferase [Dictyoglomaceae bacterium]
MRLKGRDLLSVSDLSREDIEEIFALAKNLKVDVMAGKKQSDYLKGKIVALFFEKPSTRTRISFEVGVYQLGGYPLYLNAQDMQIKRGETIADTARILERYVDGIIARVYAHSTLEELAKYSYVPIINGLSDLEHPCQIICDYFTMRERKGDRKLKVVYLGDGNNVANSLILAGAILGMDVVCSSPREYYPDSEILKRAKEIAHKTGAKIEVVEDPKEAVKDADVLYTDVWISMGQEAEREKRLKVFPPYQLNNKLLSLAKEDVIVMHCLPAHRGEEITDEVMDGPFSIVFDQAENRLHVQKAIVASLI